ncbi:MAG: hypothetical protein M3Q07_11525, partial [Pseudobdellovibrionaceae bacterium]|nr:hypothetical protein [Pseudobdellovibrionaceae bacterium]
MLILIGPRSDPETLNLSESYPAFFLEDYGTGWEIHVECGAWTLRDHAVGKTLAVDDSLKIFLRNLPQDLPLTARIMIEALQCMEQARFVGEHACDSPSTWNKPLQLALFGRMAPLTRIVNKTIEASPRTFVVKGMSTIRTRADFYETHQASRPCIEFPTMVQEALSGTEYKTHYLSESGREFFLTVMIKPQDDSLDKRYSDEGLAFTVVQNTP